MVDVEVEVVVEAWRSKKKGKNSFLGRKISQP
jgi:hypothetical protein